LRQVGFTEIWLKFDGRLSRKLCSFTQSSKVGSNLIEITQCVRVCEPGPRERKFRVKLHGIAEVLDSIEIVGFEIFGTKTVGEPPQVGIVSFGIICWLLLKGLLFRSGQLRLQCFGHGGCHFPFNAEDVFDLAIITLSPEMLVRRCANELNVDVHLVASLLDAAF